MPVRNVLVYVCDALRWDALPSTVADQGVVFKTVAQSTWSPPCFSTLSTGLYPQHHGVFSFRHELANGVRTVYDIDGLDGAYFNKHPNDRLADIFGVPQDRELEDLEEPFFCVVRDLTTHAPYDEVESTDAGAYLETVEGDWDRLVEDYRAGVEKSRALFEDMLDVLRGRNALEDTLVVFTADHGEILGEYGDVGHSNPVCPEIAYVPTVFIHPSLSTETFCVDPASEVIEQVDIVETVLSMAGFDDLPTDGVDVTRQTRDEPLGYNHVQVTKNGVSFYEAHSAWAFDGGHVFLTNPKVARVAYYLYRQLRSNHRHVTRENWRKVLGQYVRDSYRFGNPEHTSVDGRTFIETKRDLFEQVTPTETSLSDETEEQLQNMGYLT